MSTPLESIFGRINAFYDDVGRILTGDGSQLRCIHCGQTQALSEADAIHYTKTGWPKCCGYTMRLEAVESEDE